MKVEVYLKRVYGVDRFYPANSFCKMLCSILKRKTLTSEQIKKCKEWGVDVMIVPEILDLD